MKASLTPKFPGNRNVVVGYFGQVIMNSDLVVKSSNFVCEIVFATRTWQCNFHTVIIYKAKVMDTNKSKISTWAGKNQ